MHSHPCRKQTKPRMFAHGEFQLGYQSTLIVPPTALSTREAFSYVFRPGAARDGVDRVAQAKAQLGRRAGDWIGVAEGLAAGGRLVAGGESFLANGDTVRVAR